MICVDKGKLKVIILMQQVLPSYASQDFIYQTAAGKLETHKKILYLSLTDTIMYL